MKILTLALAIISAVAGFLAAYKWWVASRVEFKPFDEHGNEFSPHETQVWLNAIRLTLAKSGGLNKQAAIWTASAVGFAGLSSLAGTFSS
jgi:hypothetical protein